MTILPKSHMLGKASFIFLFRHQVVLSISQHRILAWNFTGEPPMPSVAALLLLLVRAFHSFIHSCRFDGHVLFNADYHANEVFVTRDQDLMISYTRNAVTSG